MNFNTAEYAWKDIEVVMLGRPIVRLLEVKYKVTKETKEIYGRGQNPLGIQEGNKKYEGEIKIGQSELEALINKAQQVVPGSDPTDLPQFNVAISFEKLGVLRTDVLVGVKLQEFEKAMKQGDSDMEVSLPFKCLAIDYNV
ncbi:MAG: hypothetical protein RBS07_07780 [Lentimicrobium sp.]|jgi:hypothetical protein|nr:hypothetical protein [Lentimicrobium sp.]